MSRSLGGGGHGGFVGGGNRKSSQKGGGGEQTMEIDPAIIYFTISHIRNTFSCGRTIESTLEQFRDKELTYKDLPLLLVLTDGVNYYSQNNRRLYLYKKLKSEGLLNTIEVRLKGIPSTKRMNEKFSPEKCSLSAKLMREHHANKSNEDQHEEEKHEANSTNDEQNANDSEENGNKEDDEKLYNENEDNYSDEESDGEDVKGKNATGQDNSKHKVNNETKKDKKVCNKQDATATTNNKTKKEQKEQHEHQQQQEQQQKKKNKKKDKKKSHDKESDSDEDEKNNGLTDIEKQLRELGIKTMEKTKEMLQRV